MDTKSLKVQLEEKEWTIDDMLYSLIANLYIAIT